MSVHSEYDEPVEDVIAMSKMDLRYLKTVLDSAVTAG